MTNHAMLDGRKAEILLVEDNLGDELLAMRAFKNGMVETALWIFLKNALQIPHSL